jgi:hypothetical protein
MNSETVRKKLLAGRSQFLAGYTQAANFMNWNDILPFRGVERADHGIALPKQCIRITMFGFNGL